MTREDIIAMAREAAQMPQWSDRALEVYGLRDMAMLERFAALVADAEAKRMHAEGMVTVGHMRQQIAAERNKVAQWMMAQGYATGHGDTTEDLLKELEWQVRESERNACAAIARRWDVDHPASNYGGCIANLIEARGQA
jgi:uncharacterized protein YoaH (UPF0181 family)